MKGLILKDILVLKKSFRMMALIMCIYIFMGVIGFLPLSIISTMTVVLLMTIPVSAFAYDEQSGWMRYAVTLPLGRKKIVQARYLFCVILMFAGLILGLILSAVTTLTDGSPMSENILTVVLGIGAALIIVDINLVLNYKLGTERARMWFYVIVFAPVAIIAVIAKSGILSQSQLLDRLESLSEPAQLGLLAILPAAGIIGLLISYRISCRVVESR